MGYGHMFGPSIGFRPSGEDPLSPPPPGWTRDAYGNLVKIPNLSTPPIAPPAPNPVDTGWFGGKIWPPRMEPPPIPGAPPWMPWWTKLFPGSHPKVTKDDLENGRQPTGASGATGAPAEPPSIPEILGVREPEEMGPPHIRYTLPGQPERSYIPEDATDIADTLAAGDWGMKRGGFMGVPPNKTGGAYSPPQPWENLPPETRAQFPSYWEGRRQIAGERAADLDEARAEAEEARLAELAKDPMWEEKRKAEIWADAQGSAQFAIWNKLTEQREKDIADIRIKVQGMDNLSPAQKEQKFKEMVADNDELKGYGMFLNTTKLPPVSGYPSRGGTTPISPTKPTKRT